MKIITFDDIASNEDRLAIVIALRKNGYKADIVAETNYIPTRRVVRVEVADYEVDD